MISMRPAVTSCTLTTLVLLTGCTAEPSTDDDRRSLTEEMSTNTPTPASEQTREPGHAAPRSPDAMTPQEVVNATHADLVNIALAPGDPDVRLSIWTALCRWCPDRPDGRGGSLGPPTFTGMALTTDGYETATYVRPRDPGLAYTVLSPRDDVFLLNDASNGRAWLVDVDDGTERRVARVDTRLRPADPRLWFECGIKGGWSSTWCALDVDTATAYAWPEAWSGSAVPPYVGDEPWGWEPPGWSLTRTGTVEDDPGATDTSDDPGGGTFEAWWDTNGIRQRRRFTTNAMGTVGGSAPGEMAYWTRRIGSDTITLRIGHDRGTVWTAENLAAPGFSWLQLTRAPDGALLALTETESHRLVVWRAEASGDRFRQVHQASGPETDSGGLWVLDDLVYANGAGTAAVSEDGGKTWIRIQRWR